MLDFQPISKFENNNDYVKVCIKSSAIDSLLFELQKGEKSGYVDEKTFNDKFDI